MRKVLVVDNEPVIGLLIKRGLELSKDYDVSVCTDSRDAFNAIKEQQPDIILVDVNMPGLSGPQLVQQLKSDETTRNIPCVYITGNLVAGELVDPQDARAVSIAKPFTTPQLIAVLDTVLNRK